MCHYILVILLYTFSTFTTQERMYSVVVNHSSSIEFKKVQNKLEHLIQAMIISITLQKITPDDIEAWVDSHITEDDGTDECFVKAMVNVLLLDIASLLREQDDEINDDYYNLDECVNECNCS